MKAVRSLLYVPANNREWVNSAPARYTADGYIFDLEDSVPIDEKPTARSIMQEAAGEWDDDAVITVRVNAPDTGLFEADLEAVGHEWLDGIIVPKLPRVDDIRRTDHILTYLESVRDISKQIDILALPETAGGIRQAYDICSASDRVSAVIAATSRGADAERALGFNWTAAGTEKRGYLSKLNLDGRAAGLDQIHAGAWTDVDDLAGLREELELVHSLGYTGYHVIHPDHIDPVNEVFTPDPEAVERAQALISRLESSEATEQRGAVQFEGEMIDLAHIRRAEQLLDRARAFGLLD